MAEKYYEQLARLDGLVRDKRTALANPNGVIFHHSNARPTSSERQCKNCRSGSGSCSSTHYILQILLPRIITCFGRCRIVEMENSCNNEKMLKITSTPSFKANPLRSFEINRNLKSCNFFFIKRCKICFKFTENMFAIFFTKHKSSNVKHLCPRCFSSLQYIRKNWRTVAFFMII